MVISNGKPLNYQSVTPAVGPVTCDPARRLADAADAAANGSLDGDVPVVTHGLLENPAIIDDYPSYYTLAT